MALSDYERKFAAEWITRIKAYMTECERLQHDRYESDHTKNVMKLSTYDYIKEQIFTQEELDKIKEEEEAKW